MSAFQRVSTAGLLVLLGGCAMLPQPVGLVDGKLRPCPAAPHCVSSDEPDMLFRIAPLKIKGDVGIAWVQLQSVLSVLPRSTPAGTEQAGAAHATAGVGDYLHVQVRTATMGYTDDAEFLLSAERREIGMRSCSRLGYYDFGVNRARLEAVRTALRDKGVLE